MDRGMAGWTDGDGWVNRWGEQITYLLDFFVHLSIYPIYYLFIQYISLLPCLFVYSVFSLSVRISLSVISFCSRFLLFGLSHAVDNGISSLVLPVPDNTQNFLF